MTTSEGTRPPIDRSAVTGLADEVLDWRHKAIPAGWHGRTVAELAEAGPPLSAFQTPLLTLDESAMAGNVERLARWCADRGVLLAPHGKTTMAPQLWARQLDHGAWGITLANAAQLRVGRHFGLRTIMLANSLTDPLAITWVAGEVAGGARILSWVDSTQTVDRIERVLGEHTDVVLEVLVELGGVGGRTGTRDLPAALEVARAVHASRRLRLVGVCGYEGALAHSADAEGLGVVRAYLATFAAVHERLLAEGLYDTDAVILSAGGSAYFDDVVGVLGPHAGEGRAGGPRVDVQIRSGAYIVHDDGFYRGISPFARAAPGGGPAPLRSAMHMWARVVSQPEPGLAIVDAGKRDLPIDEGFPEPQLVGPELGGPMRPLPGAVVRAVNDQHCYVRYDEGSTVRVGDVLRLGLSHPCTALDKWTLIPVLDAAEGTPAVVGLVRTFF